MDRPALPRPLRREVEVEAGHRCAIPTCRSVPIEIAHIIPWEQVQEHTFDNLIALCPTCHTRYDNGDIDRLSMMQYKANLSVLNGRYGDLERRVLHQFAKDAEATHLVLPGGLGLLLMYLLEDGLLVQVESPGAQMIIMGMPQHEYFAVTQKGRAFINHWLAADPLD